MNAELQSANDKLQISNEQLRDRTLEITDLNTFLDSILGSLEAAVIVLDRDFNVQVWTRQAHELWGLRADETVGTAPTELRRRVAYGRATALAARGDHWGANGNRWSSVARRESARPPRQPPCHSDGIADRLRPTRWRTDLDGGRLRSRAD